MSYCKCITKSRLNLSKVRNKETGRKKYKEKKKKIIRKVYM